MWTFKYISWLVLHSSGCCGFASFNNINDLNTSFITAGHTQAQINDNDHLKFKESIMSVYLYYIMNTVKMLFVQG